MQIRSVLLVFVDFSYVSSMTTYFDLGRRFSHVLVKKANFHCADLRTPGKQWYEIARYE